ncbi:MAG: hypothetical protein IJ227_03175 [Mogibacterium sp.]|nr:hypothetical protein [Mogibacterium sp.]
MNSQRKRRTLNTAIALVLAFVMAAAAPMFGSQADAASGFTSKSPFVNKTYTHNARFSGNLIVNGVDASYWQNNKTNWASAKAAGVDYTILRVTYTNYGPKTLKLNLDSKFQNHYSKAKAAGVMTGVYVFSQAKNATEGIKEADYAVARLKALGIGPDDLELPVYMDYEFAGGWLGRLHGISKKNATNAAVAFCNRIKSYGYTPGIYANLQFFRNQLDASRFAADVDLWCAQYYSKCESPVNYTKWQYSSSGKINGILNLAGIKGNTDVNFWYLNKKVAKSSVAKIYGRTTLSVNDAKAPKFNIYNGKTQLKQGTDYIVGGIRNNAKGNGFAYIKGIGKYGGYALVPLKIADKTTGKTTQDLTSVAANYLTYASKAQSSYIGTVTTSTSNTVASTIKYKKGKTYTIQTALNIRKGHGTNYGRVKRSSLSKSMKKKVYSGKYAVLKPGKKVTCKKVSGNWIKISGGWICCKSGSEVYVK